MSQAIFNYICAQPQNEIEGGDTVMRSSIPVQVRVAITVWQMPTTVPLAIYLEFQKHLFASSVKMFVVLL